MFILNIASIIIVVIILVIIISHLVSMNRKLNEKIMREKNRFLPYINKLKELEEKPALTKKDLELLSNLAKDFFKERFNLSYNKSYNELSKIFEKDSFDQKVEFCDIMANVLYAGEKIDSEGIRHLASLLLEIVEKYRYI